MQRAGIMGLNCVRNRELNELSASQEFPQFKYAVLHLPEGSRLVSVIELSRIDRYWIIELFSSSCQFSFVIPTVECVGLADDVTNSKVSN